MNEDIICPHCDAYTHNSIGNYIGIGESKGEFDYDCFYCEKEFKVRFEVKVNIEYEV